MIDTFFIYNFIYFLMIDIYFLSLQDFIYFSFQI